MKTMLRTPCLIGAAWLSLASAAFATDPITITLDTTQPKTSIPATFAGIFDASNGGRGIFDPTNAQYTQYHNMINQMGVRHWRVEGGGGDTTAGSTENDQIFSFISSTGCSGPSVMWGLWLYADPAEGVDNPYVANHIVSTPADAALLQAFAFGNEIDWPSNIAKDSYVSGYYTNKATPPFSYVGSVHQLPSGLGYWEWQRSNLLANFPVGTTASFMGCDTGDIGTETQVTDPSTGQTLPWMLRFAIDEHANIITATQHLYVGDGTNDQVAAWVGSGTPYCPGDEVYYTDPVTSMSSVYQCTTACNSENAPPNATGYWKLMEPSWQQNQTNNGGNPVAYTVGQVVRDMSSLNGNTPGTLYQCVIAQTSNDHPGLVVHNTNSMWVYGQRTQYAFPGPHQLAEQDLVPQQLTNWQNAVSGQLSANSLWPSGLPYRMTEFSPYSGPQDGAYADTFGDGYNGQTVVVNTPCHTDCFASALIGLEMFHWWARKSAVGVNPEEGNAQTNSPIFQSPNGLVGGNFVAKPYAYVWPAFNLGAVPGSGSELWQSNGGVAISSNPDNDNVSAYAVATSTDVYVTIINKTYNYDGLNNNRDISAKIDAPVGFTPSSVQYIALNTGGTAGDSTVSGENHVYLGGKQILNTNSAFPVEWTSGGSWTGGSSGSFTVTVPSFTAMIVDLKQ